MSDIVQVLIAYNDDKFEASHEFFDNCATDIRNYCLKKGIQYKTITPPNLVEREFMSSVQNSQICYIAAHGKADAIVNEKYDDIISTRTTNYNLNGKSLFAVSCYCAETLKDELKKIGLKLFVGYKSKYTEFSGFEEFYTCANSGIKIFIDGASVAEMQARMYESYNECYDLLNSKSPIAADALLDDREGLVIEGEDKLRLSDIQ